MPDPVTAPTSAAPVTVPPVDPPEPAPLPPPPVVAPVIVAPPPPPAEVPGLDEDDRKDGVAADGHRLTVPVNAFRSIKDRAATKAATDAEARMLRELGVDSVAAAQDLIRRAKETPVPDPVPPVAPVPPVTPAPVATVPPVVAPVAPVQVQPSDDKAIPEATRRQLRAEREAIDAARVKAEGEAKAAKDAAAAAIAAKDIELATFQEHARLRETLIQAGAQDVDYTFTLLQRHLKSIEKDEAALKAFDPAKWAAETKAGKPYLFGATVAPANTGAGGVTPSSLKPGEVNAGAGAAGAKDARNMTDAERAASYASMGIKFPAGSRANNRPPRS
jgi:hypothetical protein